MHNCSTNCVKFSYLIFFNFSGAASVDGKNFKIWSTLTFSGSFIYFLGFFSEVTASCVARKLLCTLLMLKQIHQKGYLN